MAVFGIYDKILGCLLGGAIGDAFGIRVEMMHYRDIEEQYGRITHFESLPPRRPSNQPMLERWNPYAPQMAEDGGFHPLGRWSDEVGVYTDDSRYQLIVCQAILRKQGPINGVDLAEEWLNYRLMAEGADEHEPTWSWAGPEKAYARHVASVDALVAMASRQRPCRAGWDTPMGIIHAGDPEQAAWVGYSMAVAVATALVPDATIDQVIANVIEYADGLGTFADELRGRIDRLVDIAEGCPDVYALREPFYREFLVTFPPWEPVFSLEMVPCALALCLIARADPEQAIVGAANLGRDSDTIATMAGQIAGALSGAASLPSGWSEKVLQLNPSPDLTDVARQLTDVISERATSQRQSRDQLLTLG
jgi:hypothetical protein